MKIGGAALIGTGMTGLLVCSVISACGIKTDMGTLAAVLFFFVMLGIALVYPDMLKERSGATSSMRVCVFMVVSAFTITVIKTGWNIIDPAKFAVDNSWVYIIGIALGAKTVQYYGEKTTPLTVSNRNTIIDAVRSAQLGTTVITPQSGTRSVPSTPPANIAKALSKNQ